MRKSSEYRTTMVCVDSYDRGALAGRFYNLSCGERRFRSLTELLAKMEDLQDEMSAHDTSGVTRGFSRPPMPTAKREPAKQGGKLATFRVRILFRQNASWQGSVSWLEAEREESFRSALELILLMDSALKSVA